MGEPRIGSAHRADQRIDHLVLDVVVQMAGGSGRAKARQRSSISLSLASVLVISARVALGRGLASACRRALALLARAILQEVQCRLDGELRRRP